MIIEIETLQTLLGLSAVDGILGIVHPWAEQAVKDFVGYQIEQASYTHYLPEGETLPDRDEFIDVQGGKVILSGSGSQNNILAVPELPLRSVASIYEDSSAMAGQYATAFPSSSLLTQGVHYYLDLDASGISMTGHIVREGSNWPAWARTVKVTYTAGFTEAELAGRYSAIQKAVALTAIQYHGQIKANQDNAGSGAIVAETLDDYSYKTDGAVQQRMTGMISGLPQAARELLSPYIRMSRFI